VGNEEKIGIVSAPIRLISAQIAFCNKTTENISNFPTIAKLTQSLISYFTAKARTSSPPASASTIISRGSGGDSDRVSSRAFIVRFEKNAR
jgi:hypothetical protein